MIEKIMGKIKEKYAVTLNWKIEKNILFFNGELKRTVIAGYIWTPIGEKPITYDKKIDFDSFKLINEKVESEIESFFKMLQEIISR